MYRSSISYMLLETRMWMFYLRLQNHVYNIYLFVYVLRNVYYNNLMFICVLGNTYTCRLYTQKGKTTVSKIVLGSLSTQVQFMIMPNASKVIKSCIAYRKASALSRLSWGLLPGNKCSWGVKRRPFNESRLRSCFVNSHKRVRASGVSSPDLVDSDGFYRSLTVRGPQ